MIVVAAVPGDRAPNAERQCERCEVTLLVRIHDALLELGSSGIQVAQEGEHEAVPRKRLHERRMAERPEKLDRLAVGLLRPLIMTSVPGRAPQRLERQGRVPGVAEPTEQREGLLPPEGNGLVVGVE